jgi:GNAT superfamily N-acetyltransferase
VNERAPKLEIVRVEDQHAEAVAAFIRTVWSPAATTASVLVGREEGARNNVAEPGVPPPTWIALQGGKVLGYVTTLPVQFSDGTRSWPGYWIKGLMVLPESRGGPIGYHVLKAAADTLDLSGGLAVAPAARRLFTALGYKDWGAIDNWLRPLRPARIVQRLDVTGLGLSGLPSWTPRLIRVARVTGLGMLAGWTGGWALRFAAAVARGTNAGFSSEMLRPDQHEEELAQLWQRCRAALGCAVVRDPAYLIPRYPTEPDGPYRWIGVRRGRSLSGVAIIRSPREGGDDRLRGIRVATVSDLLFDPSEMTSGLALLGAVERTARALGADALLASSSSMSAVRLFRRQWYVSLGGTVHLLLRSTDKEGGPKLGDSVQDWWLQRGDGGADDAL